MRAPSARPLRGILALLAVVLLWSAADARAAADPTGTYTGTHKDYDYGDCVSCLDEPAVVEVVPREGGDYFVFYWDKATPGDKAACGTKPLNQTNCVKYTATFDPASGKLTGTGLQDPAYENGTQLPLDATLNGNALSGRADWQRESSCTSSTSGCYWEFAVAREGAPEEPVGVTFSSTPADATEEPRASFAYDTVVQPRPDGTFECSLDGAAFAPCGATSTVGDLAVGEHTFSVRFRRASGLTGEAAVRRWLVDAPPIIFLPGFLGSRIVCGSGEAWPRLPDGLPRPLDMLLQGDGVTDARGACRVPSGAAGLVQTVRLGPADSDVYGSTLAFLRRIAPDRSHVYAWDWRRSPEQALRGLDDLIDQVRRPGGRVVLMAHSMGGLVTRWYLQDGARAAKVARAVTVGTPFHGSPKSFFALATGTESPAPSGFDALFDNDELQQFARNLQGLYFLWPSGAFGSWLTDTSRGAAPLLPSGEQAFAARIGGNATLLRRAHEAHAAVLDAYPATGVDLRVVAGTAVNSPRAVRVTPLPGGLARYEVEWGSGDGTVPRTSARMGSAAPAGRVHTVCGVGHVPLPGHPAVTSRIEGFLLRGAAVAGADCDRPASGVEIYLPVARLGVAATVRARGAQSGAVSLADAERRGLIEVVDVPGARIVATNGDTPVTLSIPAKGMPLRITPLGSDTRGTPVFYPATTGTLTVTTGAKTAVTRAGKALRPLKGRDRTPPRTRATVRRRGAKRIVTFRATDTSGVAATFARIGKAKERRVTRSLTIAARNLKRLRFRSIDVYGNAERPRTLR